ncbi:MAG TPA: hypothetical protein VGN52_08830 [Burkholderiales bacterium]|jgi:hypothetical protein
MNVTRLITTVLAAAAVSGGIGVAVAQNATPQNAAAPEPDSGATAPQAQVAAAPASNSASGTMTDNSAGNNSGSTEPAPQADRG